MIGFCLYHIRMFSPAIMERLTIPGVCRKRLDSDECFILTHFPGEWFWYRQKMFHENYAIHIYLSVRKSHGSC